MSAIPRLVERTRLASVLQCHERTISRAITRAGLGEPEYQGRFALFPILTISRALNIRLPWLVRILADPEECLTPAQAAQMLSMERTLFNELQARTGFPQAFAEWGSGNGRAKRYSRQNVKAAAKLFKTVAVS